VQRKGGWVSVVQREVVSLGRTLAFWEFAFLLLAAVSDGSPLNWAWLFVTNDFQGEQGWHGGVSGGGIG